MKPTDMHRMAHKGCHTHGPKGWHDVPVATGDYDLDATILHRNNKDLPLRLTLYLRKGAGYPGEGYGNYATGDGPGQNGYGPSNSYRGYLGHGDD